jgi:hypothetical protein
MGTIKQAIPEKSHPEIVYSGRSLQVWNPDKDNGGKRMWKSVETPIVRKSNYLYLSYYVKPNPNGTIHRQRPVRIVKELDSK